MLGRSLLIGRRWARDTREICEYAVARREPSKVRFVVWGPGRTGSTLFTAICNTHPEITCDGELLQFRRAFPESLPSARAYQIKTPVYGFKLKHHHLEVNGIRKEQAFIDALYEKGWRFIFLARGSLGKQAISQSLARARDLWHTTSTEDLRSVTLEAERVVALAEQMRRSDAIYRRMLKNIPFLEMKYEQDLVSEERRKRSFTRIAAFLDVDFESFDIRSPLKRTAGRSPSDYVSNFEELRERLALSGFEV